MDHPRYFAVWGLALCAACAPPSSPPDEAAATENAELLSTWEPTPEPVVRLMLEMAAPQPGELLYDLGSGDGRIVAMAAAEFGVEALGFEIDEALVERSRALLASRGLENRARVEARDLMLADYSAPDVITCYLTPEGLAKVTPKLEAAMRPGSRLAAYKFPLPGWEPDEVRTLVDPDPEIPLHEVFLYRR